MSLKGWGFTSEDTNDPLRYIDPDGNSVKDITYGFASALDDNVLGGFGKFLLKKILHTGERVNDSDYVYYLGRVAGDVVSALIGGVLSAKGVVDILGSIVFGGGITVTSGGTLAIGGIAICVEGVLAGSVEVVYGERWSSNPSAP